MSGFGKPRSLVARGVLALACLGLALPAVATPAAAESRRADQWGLDLLAAEFVHPDVDGSGVVVAVLDTDIAAGHSDLVGRLVQGYDFVEDRPFDPLAADRQTARVDHGTMVAALIVGDADGDGITGVAPGARVMPVRVVPDFEQGTTTALADGIRWAADNGADVLNISIRTRTDSPRLRQAVEYAVGKGVIVVSSGGSNDEGPWYPAALSEVIAVGAIERDLDLYPGSPSAPYIELVAPGADVVSASGRDAGGYLNGRGTSFAAPHVAGTVAMMRQVAPRASLAEIREALHATARDLGPTGRDDEFGFGLLDLVGSVMWIDRRDPEPPSVSQLDAEGSSLVLSLDRGPSFDVLAHEITVDGEVVATTGAEASTVRIDLEGRTGQRVEVRSRDAAGRTSTAFGVVSPPVAVRAEARPGAVSVTWQSPAQPGVLAYDVAVDDQVVVRVVNGDLSTHSTNLVVAPGASPRISVAAIGPHGIVSSWVEAPRAQALDVDRAPSAPGSLSAQAATAAVGLAWERSEGSVDRYVVERNGEVIASVAATVNSFVDRAAQPGATYRYRVFAEGPGGRSEPSAGAEATALVSGLEALNWGVVTSNGRVFTTIEGLETLTVARPIVAGALTPSGQGFWLVSADGLVTAHGDAAWFGDVSNLDLAGPIVDMAATQRGDGYWLVGADGGVFALGAAGFAGSAAQLDLDGPVVSISPTDSGRGYILVAADGGVFAYGDASYRGQAGALRGSKAVTGAVMGSAGYLVLSSEGGVFSFDQTFHGSLVGLRDQQLGLSGADAVSIAGRRDGSGYVLLQADGRLVGFGSLAAFDAVPLVPGERALDLLFGP